MSSFRAYKTVILKKFKEEVKDQVRIYKELEVERAAAVDRVDLIRREIVADPIKSYEKKKLIFQIHGLRQSLAGQWAELKYLKEEADNATLNLDETEDVARFASQSQWP